MLERCLEREPQAVQLIADPDSPWNEANLSAELISECPGWGRWSVVRPPGLKAVVAPFGFDSAVLF